MDSLLISILIFGLFLLSPSFPKIINRILYNSFCLNKYCDIIRSIFIKVSIVLVYRDLVQNLLEFRIADYAFLKSALE